MSRPHQRPAFRDFVMQQLPFLAGGILVQFFLDQLGLDNQMVVKLRVGYALAADL